MNKSLIASLIFSGLLAGCGSSSSTPTVDPTPVVSQKYQWQVVQLKSMQEASLAVSCVIYADSVLNEDEVITAYIAEQDYNIIYHNADGSIFETIPADEISNGLITIDVDDVPDEGYVSLEEYNHFTGIATGSYMLSVQKSLLSDMVVNINQQQYGDCYAGYDYREVASGTAQVNVNQPLSNPSYYQSSYDESAVNGQETSAYIPVNSPFPASRDTLITAFQDYDAVSGQKSGLSHWAFIDSSSLYEGNSSSATTSSELSSDYLTPLYWSNSDDVNLTTESGVIAIHSGTSYFWQPIYADSAELAVAYDSDEITLWSSYFSGTVSQENWIFTSFSALIENQTDISLPEFPVLYSTDSVSISSSCNTNISTGLAAAFCIDTAASFDSDNFDYQRTHLRMKEMESDVSKIAYQTVYAEANDEPVVLQSELIEFTDPTLVRTEFNLMSSDADSIDAVQYLMTQNIDLVNVGEYSAKSSDDDAATNYFSDIQGVITTDTESTSLYHAMLDSTTTTLMSTYEPSSD